MTQVFRFLYLNKTSGTTSHGKYHQECLSVNGQVSEYPIKEL